MTSNVQSSRSEHSLEMLSQFRRDYIRSKISCVRESKRNFSVPFSIHWLFDQMKDGGFHLLALLFPPTRCNGVCVCVPSISLSSCAPLFTLRTRAFYIFFLSTGSCHENSFLNLERCGERKSEGIFDIAAALAWWKMWQKIAEISIGPFLRVSNVFQLLVINHGMRLLALLWCNFFCQLPSKKCDIRNKKQRIFHLQRIHEFLKPWPKFSDIYYRDITSPNVTIIFFVGHVD